MKALSLTQPWASLCVWPSGRAVQATGQVVGEKEYETRSMGCTWARNIKPQLLLIHAAKTFPKSARNLLYTQPFCGVAQRHGVVHSADLPTGAIIGSVWVCGSIATENIRQRLSSVERNFGNYENRRWAIRFVEPILFPHPYPCKGLLGLWTPPDEILTQICVVLDQFRPSLERIHGTWTGLFSNVKSA